MKKNRGDEPIGVINIYTWKYHKETPCIATFISKKEKCHFFSFFLYKIREQEGPAKGVGESGGLVPVWLGKRGKRVNTVQKCVHIYANAKTTPVETISGMGGGGDKG
jgi:hypothetical protein